VRGVYRSSTGQLYAVGGNKFYSVSSAWVATELGALNSSSGPISMADNGISVVVVDGTDGYVCTISGGAWAEITAPDFYASDLVTFQDGYFLFTKKGTQQFFYTDIDATTFDASGYFERGRFAR
jgi:hypothetical protein